jgi:hypothetical protein
MTRIDVGTFDDIIGGGGPDTKSASWVVFTLCERGCFNRKALARAVVAWRALKLKSTACVTINVAGYDDDPRELWEIEEVRDFVQRFCRKTRAHEHEAVEPMSKGVLIACGADPELEVAVTPITYKEAIKGIADFAKDRKEKR